jgi:hypothetical protein
MTKTIYKACVAAGMSVNATWKRVYTDGDKLYIKVKGGYKCITGTPAADMLVEE